MYSQPYLPVNWIDGMKINKSHFIAQDNALRHQVAQSTSGLLNDHNYGLLPGELRASDGVKLLLSMDNQQRVQIRLQRCKAVTRGGHVFQFDDENIALRAQTPPLTLPELSTQLGDLKKNGTSFYIVLTFNPFQRTPCGAADPNEIPARIPYTTAQVSLSILPEQEIKNNPIGLFQFPVGRIQILENKPLLEESYIPPCATINSHFELVELHAVVERFYAGMENYTIQIIQKILQKKQSNEMAGIVQKLCENYVAVAAPHVQEVKIINLLQTPVCLVTKICSIARLLKNTLDCYIGSGKEELLNYCAEWCEVTQGELEGCMTDLSNHTYNHLDINNSVRKVLHFINTISSLFVNLARLEYIGKRKDAGIFVKERIVRYDHDTPAKTRTSFLAD